MLLLSHFIMKINLAAPRDPVCIKDAESIAEPHKVNRTRYVTNPQVRSGQNRGPSRGSLAVAALPLPLAGGGH
jgi:hypothetical protein